ncbi:VOC family protein [Chelativorans salis]|uniref:VOC family protein n=1 Tax=Chelativorans salis TaxID=2978478 RepID=A0ABT2LJC8_9HYPH|nr:VOC family protein [Chelativorans sp. EGI FJ00035]MCT7374695.1 VOC family protein [Chelativorans sp. EGI FJ00035]
MAVDFNHTIVWSRDRSASAAFLAEMLGLPAPSKFGPFDVVKTNNGVNVDFAEKAGEISAQHYAFLVNEVEFDEILSRIRAKGLPYWADPAQQKDGEINTHDGGRGLYFEDLNGHLLEIITRPYGSGGWQP